MLDSLERMTISARFVKYRPDVPLKGNASRWFVMQFKANNGRRSLNTRPLTLQVALRVRLRAGRQSAARAQRVGLGAHLAALSAATRVQARFQTQVARSQEHPSRPRHVTGGKRHLHHQCECKPVWSSCFCSVVAVLREAAGRVQHRHRATTGASRGEQTISCATRSHRSAQLLISLLMHK